LCLRIVNDTDDSVVSENQLDYPLDDDVKEDALEIPEEFLLAKLQELDVEDELEGDFKCVTSFLPSGQDSRYSSKFTIAGTLMHRSETPTKAVGPSPFRKTNFKKT